MVEVNTEAAEGKAIQYQLVNSEKSAEERRKRSRFEKSGDEVNASEDTAKRDCGIKKKYNSIKKIKEQN